MDVSDEEDQRPIIEVRLDQGAVELDFRAANWERAVRDLAVSLTSVMAEETLGSETLGSDAVRTGNIEVWDDTGRLIAAFSARFKAYRRHPEPDGADGGCRAPETQGYSATVGGSLAVVCEGCVQTIRQCSDALIRTSLLALREPAYPIDFVVPNATLPEAASRG